MKRKTAVFATLVLILFVSCGFTTVNATTTDSKEIRRNSVTVNDDKESDIWDPILEPYKEGCSGYWNYVLNELHTQDYYQITEELYKKSQELNYNVLTMVQDCENFQVLVKEPNGKNLISADNVISTIVSSSNDAGGLNNWNTIQLNNLDMRYYDEIIDNVVEDGNRTDVYQYEIVDIIKAKDGKRFSLRLEMTSYLVIEGNTLSEIAERKLTTVEKLVELNPQIEDPNLIYPGWVLKTK